MVEEGDNQRRDFGIGIQGAYGWGNEYTSQVDDQSGLAIVIVMHWGNKSN